MSEKKSFFLIDWLKKLRNRSKPAFTVTLCLLATVSTACFTVASFNNSLLFLLIAIVLGIIAALGMEAKSEAGEEKLERSEEERIALQNNLDVERQSKSLVLEKYSRAQEMLRDSSKFAHDLQHETRKLLASKDSADYEQDAMDFCTLIIKELEEVLSKYYCVDVRASLKLIRATHVNSIITPIRGDRDFRSKQSDVPRDIVPIDKNTVYEMIYERIARSRHAESFSVVCGDICGFNKKFGRAFKCEYGADQEIFKSTMCITIRSSGSPADGKKVLGFICIDTKDVRPDWDDDDYKKTFAFQTLSMVCDSFYLPLAYLSDAQSENTSPESVEMSSDIIA